MTNNYYILLNDDSYCKYTNTNISDANWIRAVVIWREGSKGGIKIICDKRINGYSYGYITRNACAMKDFMWAKLAAVEL